MTLNVMGMWPPQRVNSKKDAGGFLKNFFVYILHSVAQIVHILYPKYYKSFTGLACSNTGP